MSAAATVHRAGRSGRTGRGTVPCGDQCGQVSGGAAGDEASTGGGGKSDQIGEPPERLVLGPDRAGPFEPASPVGGRGAQHQVEQDARPRRGAGDEGEVRGVIRRDRGGCEHVRPDAQRPFAADALSRDRLAGALRELLGRGRAVERREIRDAGTRVVLERPRELLGLWGEPVHLVRLVRQPASSWQKPWNASTYFWMSSSVCCTEMVHCSSSPGVMKIPRLIIHENDA